MSAMVDVKRRITGLLAVFTSLLVTLAVAAPASAEKLGSRPNWGACGILTNEQKMVYDFGGVNLRCGTASWGYRHIKNRHFNEFQNLARAGGLNWSDLVHWAIHFTIKDPDNTITGCRDRVIFLHDRRNGNLVWQQRFKMIYNTSNGQVITVYPSSKICTR